jgi:hypothetical protein
MNADCGLARNATASATSSDLPKRPKLVSFFRISAIGPSAGLSSVSIGPGWTFLTVTPAAREAADGELGAGVESYSGHRDGFAEGRADVDDAAPSCFRHASSSFARELKNGADIEVELPIERFVRRLCEQTGLESAGVVHQHVKAPSVAPASSPWSAY